MTIEIFEDSGVVAHIHGDGSVHVGVMLGGDIVCPTCGHTLAGCLEPRPDHSHPDGRSPQLLRMPSCFICTECGEEIAGDQADKC